MKQKSVHSISKNTQVATLLPVILVVFQACTKPKTARSSAPGKVSSTEIAAAASPTPSVDAKTKGSNSKTDVANSATDSGEPATDDGTPAKQQLDRVGEGLRTYFQPQMAVTMLVPMNALDGNKSFSLVNTTNGKNIVSNVNFIGPGTYEGVTITSYKDNKYLMTLSPDSSRTKISNGRNSLILKSENEFYAMSVAYDLTFDVFSYFEGLSSINEDATESIQDLTTRMYVPHFSSSAVTDGKFVLSTGFVPVLTR